MKWVYAEDWPGETPPAWGMGGGTDTGAGTDPAPGEGSH
jgi:hypothetical protein